MSSLRITFAAGLAALLATGCLSEPAGRSCADLPPGAAGCDPAETDEGPTPDMAAADRGADAAPSDTGPADMAPDGPWADAATDDTGPDMAPGDAAPGDAAPADAAPADAAPADMAPADDGPPLECAPGTSRPCSTDVGACRAGQQFCDVEGVYDDCLGAVGPVDEACNGQDDDCDGETDEGCDCVDDAMQPCGSDVGACDPGMQICVDGAWGPCQGATDGTPEVCDGVDNDCNGVSDDLPAIVEGQMCSVGVGRCRASGPFTCDRSNDGSPVCLADPGPPMPEACNLLDDDCDGTLDEGVPINRSLLSSGRRAEQRPAIAPFGEFHGVAWIDDGRVFFGLASGDAWEIDPVDVGHFNGDDTIATHLAMAPVPGAGFKIAVAYDGLGAGLSVLDIDAGGRDRREPYAVETNRAGAVSIAYQAAVGFAVAFERADPAAGTTAIDVELVPDLANGRPTRTTLARAQTAYRQPSVVLVNGAPVVAALETDVRLTAGGVVLAPMGDGTGLARAVYIGGRPSGRNPALHNVPGQPLYALTWDDDSGDAGQIRAVRVALVDREGRVVSAVTLPAVGSAIRPSLAPIALGRGPADRIAVTWERPGPVGFNIDLGWVLDTGRGWVASPGVDRVFGEQGSTTGSRVAYAGDGAGVGVVLTYDDTRNSAAVFASLPGACPERP